MGERYREIDGVSLNKNIVLICMLMLLWAIIFVTQIFLPIGFQIMVVVALVFTSKIGVIVKQSMF
jgi:hypothetical protein